MSLQKRKFNILVLDDDPKIRELLQVYFNARNEEVTCTVVADIQQASLLLFNQDFDLVLIDNIMPIKLGIDYALYLRRSNKYAQVPIVLMSGALLPDDIFKAIEGGVREVLVKPFTLKQLSKKIAPHISNFHQI